MEVRFSRQIIRDRLRARLAMPAEALAAIGDMPAAVRARLGLPDSTAAVSDTRANLRAALYQRAGDTATAGLTTFADPQANALLIAANRWGRLQMPWVTTALDLVAEGTVSDVDGELVILTALVDYAIAAGDQVAATQWLGKRDARLLFLQVLDGPRMAELLGAAERLAFFDDEVKVLFACAELARMLGRTEAAQSFDSQIKNRLERLGSTANLHLNSLLDEAAAAVFADYTWVRLPQSAYIGVVAGTRFITTLPSGMLPENVLQVGWLDSSGYIKLARLPIPIELNTERGASGSVPPSYGIPVSPTYPLPDAVAARGTPSRYQFGEKFELWQVPVIDGELKIVYTINPTYLADGDILPIDGELILLYAAAQWCEHRGKTRLADNFRASSAKRALQLKRHQSGLEPIAPGQRAENRLRSAYIEPRPNYGF